MAAPQVLGSRRTATPIKGDPAGSWGHSLRGTATTTPVRLIRPELRSAGGGVAASTAPAVKAWARTAAALQSGFVMPRGAETGVLIYVLSKVRGVISEAKRLDSAVIDYQMRQ